MLLYISVIGVLFVGFVLGASEGDSCNNLDKVGTCVNIRNCSSATEDLIRNNIHPKICYIQGKTVLVCCFDSTNDKITDEPRPIVFSDDNDKIKKNKEKPNDEFPGCPPVPKKYTTEKTGKVSWDKCIEYQQKYIFPCMKNGSEYHRRRKCLKKGDESKLLGSNGEDAILYEFTHMVMLGYGEEFDTNLFLCGGSIISEKFILTAGHCLNSIRGNVTRVVTGALKFSNIAEYGQIYNVKRAIRHPDFKPPAKYDDIALLETREQIELSKEQVPACLHTGRYTGSHHTQVAFATGWGALSYKGERPDVLQKMRLQEFDKHVCINQFLQLHRHLMRGYDDSSQLCYGDRTGNTDTCDGDSGGPLQIEHPDIFCMHLVLGVTSFGIRCGEAGRPAAYTRVERYVPWIESIVWPEG